MSSTTDLLIKNLAKTITETPGKKSAPYDTQAEVRRVEGDIAWVHIPGGVDETPVQLTTNAKKGDIVQVRVSGGRAWLYGNATAPPTDDTTANKAQKTASVADEHATNAITSAMLAQQFADQAKDDASRAKDAADTANGILDQMEEAAEEADMQLLDIFQKAKDADEAASAAAEDAEIAYNSASMAMSQLSIVEDIVGVLSLVAENGTYERTQDDTPLPDKWYFTRSGAGTTADPYVYNVQPNVNFEYIHTSDTTIVEGKPYYTRSGSGTEQDPYVYTPVATPVQADIGTYYEYTNWNYYELTGVDQAIQNYISSHLVLAGDSLFLQTSSGEGTTRLELNTQNGMTLYDQTGSKVAQYGTETIIGNENGFYVKIDGTEIGFYQQAQKVAYINGNKLYITQSVVLQQMDVGTAVASGGLGQWSWKVHEVDGMNNLYLKWLG